MKTLLRFVSILWLATATPLLSHEFWIDGEQYQVETGEKVAAWLRNGQNFKGIDLAYFTKRVVRFDQIENDVQTPVLARAGDSPAYAKEVATDGLFTLIYQSAPSRLTYKEWEKFQSFVDHKAFGDVRSAHAARGLSESEFGETYTRYAKALFGVGSGAGTDAPRGLELEITALKNPYTDDVSQGLPVRVTYRDMPRVNAQVEIFEKPKSGDVTISTLRTNDEGIALIPVKAGHSYLLDNVVLREPSAERAEEYDAVWETLWIALTFAVPE